MGTAVGQTFDFKQRAGHRLVLVIFVALLTLVYTERHVHITATLRCDFETFCYMAHMVRDGGANRLYDFSAQAAYQMRYIDPNRKVTIPDLPFVYPAAALLPFLPLTWLPPTLAFAIWTTCSLGWLIASVRLLQRHLAIPQDDLPIFVALLFLPVCGSLLHGQLSILMFFLYALAFSFFKDGRPFLAGVALGLGTLKFQLVVGFFAVMLLRRCWKFLAGAGVGASVVALLSAAVIGWRGTIRYPLALMQSGPGSLLDTPQTMVSLRGIVAGVIGHTPADWVVAVLSIGLIVGVALLWKDFEIGFSMAILVAILVAYHAYFQELTLLLIPLAVIVSRLKWNEWLSSLVAFALIAMAIVGSFGSVQVAAVLAIAGIAFGLWYTESTSPRAAAGELTRYR